MSTFILSYVLSLFMYYLAFFFFFNDTATTEIYTLSLHDALPIYPNLERPWEQTNEQVKTAFERFGEKLTRTRAQRDEISEEHTSELQSQSNLVCRLLLEKKIKKQRITREQKTTQTNITQNTNNDK